MLPANINMHARLIKTLSAVALCTLAFGAANVSGQIITNAYDVGTNYVGAGNFFTGDNGGFGFGPWAIIAGGGGQSLVANDSVQYGEYSFTLTNLTAGGVTTANRPFSSDLPVGGSFSVRFRLENLDNAGFTNGFQLQDAGGNVLFSFYHKGGDNANGWFTDASGQGVATNFSYNYLGFTSLEFTLNSATTYTFKDINNGATFSGALSGAPISQVTFFRANTNAAPSNGQVFSVNALAITTLGSKPVFDVQPKNTAAIAGGTITLNAHANSNLGTPDYQWYFANGPISGATGTNLVLSNVGVTNAGDYFVVATNMSGMTTSAVAMVTIIPFGYTNAYDTAANYSSFTGNQGFGFAPWAVNTAGGGSYINSNPKLFAIWNNTGGGASTAVRPFTANLSVGGSFLVQLQNNSLDNPTNMNILELQDAGGNVVFSYWHQGGDLNQGNGHYSDAGVTDGIATNFWYDFQQVDTFAFTLTSDTTYKFTDLASGVSLTGVLSGTPITQVTFVRTNGSTGSQSSGQDFKFNHLMVLSPSGEAPVFSIQPQYNGGLVGSSLNLSGTAVSSSGSLNYQWYFGNTLLTGETNSNLSLGNVDMNNSGDYYLVAANAFGSTTSMVSVVTIYLENNRQLAYEGFDYTEYGQIGVDALDGGYDWNGGWVDVGGADGYINPGSLIGDTNVPSNYDSLSTGNSYYNYGSSRAGRWLDCSTNGVFAARGYLDQNGNIGAAGKTVYVSFLMQPDVTTMFYEFEFHRGDLGDGGRIAGIGNDVDTGNTNDVFFRQPDGTFVDLGLGDSFEDPSFGNHVVDFYVVRIDYQPGNADNVRIYRNPTSVTEPETATATLTNVGDMSFNGISLGAYLGNLLAVDEIRIGATWDDALGLPGSNSMMTPLKQGADWLIQFAGNPSYTYRVQRATSVNGPWTDLGTATPAESGVGTFDDTTPPADTAFYRVVTP